MVNVRLVSRLTPGRTLLYTSILMPLLCDGTRLILVPRGYLRRLGSSEPPESAIELELRDFTEILIDDEGADP